MEISTRIAPQILQGKLALVTGAGQGNGKAIAFGVAQAGARVVVTDLNAANAKPVATDIAATGATAWGYALDLSSPAQCEAMKRAFASLTWHRLQPAPACPAPWVTRPRKAL